VFVEFVLRGVCEIASHRFLLKAREQLGGVLDVCGHGESNPTFGTLRILPAFGVYHLVAKFVGCFNKND
jgi:hypothetical protein